MPKRIPITATIRPLHDRHAPAGARMFVVTEQIFKTETLFVVGCDYELFRLWLNTRYKTQVPPNEDRILGTLLTFQLQPWRVVYVKRYEIPIMVHELLHLVTRLCYDRSVPIVSHHPNGDLGDETASYLLEFYTLSVMQALGHGAPPRAWAED